MHQYSVTTEGKRGTRSYEMARRLMSAVHEVELVSADSSGIDFSGWRKSAEAGIRAYRLSVPYDNSMMSLQRIKALLKFALGSARKAASKKTDVVFATSAPLTMAISAVYAAKRQRIPMGFEVRDLWPEFPIAEGALNSRLTILAA